MAINEDTITRLRAAAVAGNPDAARELGRLLRMLRTDSLEDAMDSDFLATWPEEPWLRAALRARPDDRLAAVLLAGRLVQQIAFRQIDDDHATAHGEDDGTLARRHDEAHALYASVLRTDPGNAAARAGVAALNAWADDTGDLEKEPRGALGLLPARGPDGGAGRGASLRRGPRSVHLLGRLDSVVRLARHFHADGTLDWDAVEIPPLTGDPLPAGHPVGIGHYGYFCDWG
jgi:hypothetical protein